MSISRQRLTMVDLILQADPDRAPPKSRWPLGMQKHYHHLEALSLVFVWGSCWCNFWNNMELSHREILCNAQCSSRTCGVIATATQQSRGFKVRSSTAVSLNSDLTLAKLTSISYWKCNIDILLESTTLLSGGSWSSITSLVRKLCHLYIVVIQTMLPNRAIWIIFISMETLT